MTDYDWTIHALEKLRGLKNKGYLKGFVGWPYQSNDKDDHIKENVALLKLETEGIITVWTDESGAFIPDKDGILVTGEDNFGAYDLTTGNIERNAIVGNFNIDKFKQVCTELGINADKELVKARIYLKGIGTPVVTILGKEYEFNSMKSDSYKERLFEIVSKKPGQVFTVKDLKELSNFGSIERITDLTENNYFTRELSPFVDITKDTIIFHDTANLTKEQVKAIEAKSRKNPNKS